MAHALHYRGQVLAASGLDITAGLWLIVSPSVMSFHVRAIWMNNIILGILIGIIAFYRFMTITPATAGLSWVNVVLGIWVLASPWALGFANIHPAMAHNVALGIIVIILACWSAMASISDRTSDIKRDSTINDDLA